VALVGTLLTWQALFWFAPLFEKKSPILNNFERFLAAFEEAFRKHGKNQWTTNKIQFLQTKSTVSISVCIRFQTTSIWNQLGRRSTYKWISLRTKRWRQELTIITAWCPNTQWDLSEIISQVVKYDSQLFQRRQD